MAFEHIKAEVQDRILTLTLNRPDKLNAFVPQMRDEMVEAFGRADHDDEVRVIIVTGAGRAFCAGADLSSGAETFDYTARGMHGPAADQRWRDGGGEVTLRIFESLKPVIAAVNGPAVGVGVTMQLPMDIRMASEEARFGFVFSRRGVVPEACSSWFLPRLVGIQQAMEWVATGRIFNAEEALRGGLLRSVHKAEELMPAARELAREIASNTSAISVALARQMLWRMMGADHPMEAHRLDSRAIFELGRSVEAKEGVASFLEKRPPRFPGRVPADMPGFFPWWSPRDFS